MLDSCHICGASLMKLHGTVKCVACGAVYENLYSNEENVLLENAFETLANTSFEEAEQLFCDLNKNYPENGEAYWGCLLSKYGIKYEKDYDGTMVPTFYKVPDSNMIEDSLLKEAIHNSTENVAHYFESEAKKLEALRIEWVEKASKEPSFDIFISHKSDLEDDSNRAKDIYDALQKNKLRPFYSEESLKDKVGEKYEPYIFQAIEKSKAMVLYVNSPEEVESTWIKNEWHRFAKLVSQKKKVSNSLIIICDGFLAKELPKELAAFQCIEVSNGEDFMPLLLLQINKILKLAKKVNTKKNSKLATQIALLSIVAVAVISIILLVQNSNRDDISSTTNNSSILPSSTTIDSITLEQTTLVDTSATSTSENTSTTLDETTIITDATTTITTDVSTSNEETTVIVGTTTEYTTEYTTEETTQITTEVTTEATTTEAIVTIIEDRYVVDISNTSTTVLYDTKYGFYFWKKYDGTYCLAGYSDRGCDSDGEVLVIPSHIDGVEVNEIQYRFEDYPSLSGNDQTKELHIPSTIKMIGFQAFSEWTSLEKVVIDEGVTCIDTSSFSNCLNLKEINFPSTLRTIGAYAFNNCYRLSNIVFNDGLLDVQDRAFMYCISLKNIVIPESVEKMGFGVFEECTGIESIDFKTTKLVEFDGIVVRCRNLKSLVLPEGIVELGSCVELEQITYIEIPSTVKQIYNNCFAMCKSLETIWIRGCPTLIGDNLVSGYPGGVICFETDRALSSWADFNKENYRVIYGVKEKPVNIEYQSISRPQEGQIRDSQFIPLYDSFGNLQEYYDTVQGVYYKVFDGEVAVIGYDGHGGNVYIPAYVHGLPVKSCAAFEHPLFQGNGNITGLYLPGTLVEVQSDFFANMESLESVFIEDGTEKIFGYQFNSCKNLRSVRLPNTLKTIKYGAFGACERLMSITLPENLEVIERQAFAACQSFKYVTVPASVKVVEDMAFSSCWNLKGLYFEGIPTIGLDQVAYDDLATIYFKYSKDRYDLSGFETFFGPLVFDVSISPFE